ncbi:MAG: Gfo/Idh/MocA family oxidoreductase [Campylobacteraceae bacterium]|nr:Gfo/Idh/MocA family oxidoreductase [Campylobacteraceae bacterium]
MKKKIAIIGLGKYGKKHLSELRRSDYFELVGVCDKDSSLEEFGRFEFFNDIDSMFSASKPDAVIIATPPKTHKEIILKSMRYVKNIFVESPCTESLEQVREMKYATSTSNVKVAVGFSQRFNPATFSLLREFEKEEQIYAMSIIRACPYSESLNLVDDLLIKDIDLVRYLLKTEISSFDMKKTVQNSKNSIQCSDDAPSIIHSSLKTKNGVLVNICSNSFYPEERAYMEISAKNGVYVADFVDFNLYKITKNGRVNLRVDSEDFSIRHQHRCFAKVCETGEFEEIASIEDAVKAREALKL